MTTVPVNYLLTVEAIYELNQTKDKDVEKLGTLACIPDLFKEYISSAFKDKNQVQAITHFMGTPGGNNSWMIYPVSDLKRWNFRYLRLWFMNHDNFFYAGGTEIIPENMWSYNEKSLQNQMVYLHLLQDKKIEMLYQAEKITAGALNNQIYYRLAKRYYDMTGDLADNLWLSVKLKHSAFKMCSSDMAMGTIMLMSIPSPISEMISEKYFDHDKWFLPNEVIDKWIDCMMDDMKSVLSSVNSVFDNK